MTDKHSDNNDTNTNSPSVQQGSRDDVAQHAGMQAGRRRFLLRSALVGSSPILMSLASRPVLANQCTISGMISGNLSGPQVACRGLTPGYWGQHPDTWGQCGYNPGTSVGGWTGKHSKQNQYQDDGTKFHDPGLGFSGNLYNTMTMMQVIQSTGGNYSKFTGSTDPYQLGAHAVAALLNAEYFGPEEFGYTPNDIRDMWTARYLTDPEGLKLDFQALNERG